MTTRNYSALKHLAILGIAVVALSGNQAGIPSGVIRRVEVPAPSLRGNLLGDPAARRVSIYLPERYFTHPRQRFPVIYLLHGFSADDRAFIAGAYQGLNVRVSMDSLIAAGKVEPMIVVTPNARNRFDGSFYTNSVTTGKWEDFIVRDLVGYVDRHFRTIRSASGRGVAGHSMGGLVATALTELVPDRVTRLVLVNSPPSYESRTAARGRRRQPACHSIVSPAARQREATGIRDMCPK